MKHKIYMHIKYIHTGRTQADKSTKMQNQPELQQHGSH